MDGGIIAAWATVGGVAVTSIISCIRTSRANNRLEKNREIEAGEKFGQLKGTVDGLGERIGSLETQMTDRMQGVETQVATLGKRIDNLVNSRGTKHKD